MCVCVCVDMCFVNLYKTYTLLCELCSRITSSNMCSVTKIEPVWRNNNVSLGSKVKQMRSLYMSIFFYAYES